MMGQNTTASTPSSLKRRASRTAPSTVWISPEETTSCSRASSRVMAVTSPCTRSMKPAQGPVFASQTPASHQEAPARKNSPIFAFCSMGCPAYQARNRFGFSIRMVSICSRLKPGVQEARHDVLQDVRVAVPAVAGKGRS